MRAAKGPFSFLLNFSICFHNNTVQWTDLRYTFIRKARVVLSIDLMCTFDFGDIGVLASFKGLKLKTVDTILLAIDPRVRTRMLRQFKVALTSTASLQHGC